MTYLQTDSGRNRIPFSPSKWRRKIHMCQFITDNVREGLTVYKGRITWDIKAR